MRAKFSQFAHTQRVNLSPFGTPQLGARGGRPPPPLATPLVSNVTCIWMALNKIFTTRIENSRNFERYLG